MNLIKVLMLICEQESSRLLFNGLRSHFNIERVIIETPVSKRRILKRRVKKLGLMTVIGQVFFMLYNRQLKKKISTEN